MNRRCEHESDSWTNPIARDLATSGYSVLPNFLPGRTTIEAAAALGNPIDISRFLPNSTRVQDLRPRDESDGSKNTYSGNFGRRAFPLHTDLAHWAVPPRYFLLRCVSGANTVATLVLSWNALAKSISRSTLSRAIFRIRKPRSGFSTLRRAFSHHGEGELFRWDSLFLIPHTSSASQLCTLMQSSIWEEIARKVILQKPNDSILVDNWTTLHGRGPVTEDQINRHLQRVYIGDLFQ